jgi:hypothetical protein
MSKRFDIKFVKDDFKTFPCRCRPNHHKKCERFELARLANSKIDKFLKYSKTLYNDGSSKWVQDINQLNKTPIQLGILIMIEEIK